LHLCENSLYLSVNGDLLMKKIEIYAAFISALALFSTVSFAEDMEKCQVVKNGQGLIKEHKADCASASSHSCAGQNKAGDPESWIIVPKGQCAKINAGDFSGVSPGIKDKIEGAI
jgi:uncharacterized membrane protein